MQFLHFSARAQRDALLVFTCLTLSACFDGASTSPGGASIAPKSVQYPEIAPLALGEPVDIAPTIDGGQPDEWQVFPSLPIGLSVGADGRIQGTPTRTTSPDGFTIIAKNSYGQTRVDVNIAVLPEDVRGLAPTYWVELVAGELELPVKLRFTDDGRLIFGELLTGRIRVVGSDGKLRPTPLATLPVGHGPQAGLLGIALPPDHLTSREVYAYTIGNDDLGRVYKVREADSANETPVPALVVGDLPSGTINNGGDLEFGPDGKLYLTIGDCGIDVRAQRDGDSAGRILRFNRDGSIPQDNPVASSLEWCRGLRNAFDMAFHPVTGGLFAIDNASLAEDRLILVSAGDNFGWPEIPATSLFQRRGRTLATWTPNIAPTGIAWHNGRGANTTAGADLYIASYNDVKIRRLRMGGSARDQVEEERSFLEFRVKDSGANVPLGIAIDPHGRLHIATATAIWRIVRHGGDVAPMPTK